ncbi:MAG: hypothetical protein KDD36_01725 [Flavobacteriales bacterium]|nr:hypothetical protein [Flavobacteriales bacterium]
MSKLNLDDTEVFEMRTFYEEELDRAIRRVQHIQNVLGRLGANVPALETLSSTTGIRTPNVGEKKVRQRPGRKSVWEQMILKRLRQVDRPLTYDELTDELMVYHKIPKEKLRSTRQAVISVTFRLRNRDHKIDTFSMGRRQKYIALKSWFNGIGKINPEYAEKINVPGKKTRKAKASAPVTKAKATKATTRKTVAKVGRPRKTRK